MAVRNWIMRCPTCKKEVTDDGPDKPATYPFCSERCRLIDLGRWLDEKYQIPAVEPLEEGSTPSGETNGGTKIP